MSRYRYYEMILDALYAMIWDMTDETPIQPAKKDIRTISFNLHGHRAGIILQDVNPLWSYER